MSTRKQREMLRLRRIEFDKRVEEARKEEPKKRRGRPKKKVD